MLNMTNTQIIDLILNTIGPEFIFSVIPYTNSLGDCKSIESMDMLYFRLTDENILLPEDKLEEGIEKIKQLDLKIESVVITNFYHNGKFIEVKLLSYHYRLLNRYDKFIQFKNKQSVINKVDEIDNFLKHTYPSNPIPRDFIEISQFIELVKSMNYFCKFE